MEGLTPHPAKRLLTMTVLMPIPVVPEVVDDFCFFRATFFTKLLYEKLHQSLYSDFGIVICVCFNQPPCPRVQRTRTIAVLAAEVTMPSTESRNHSQIKR